MKVLTYNPNLCTGARECEKVCAQTWFKVTDREHSSIRIFEQDGKFRAEFCIQCGECIKVCPTNALSYDKLGIVRVKKDLCVGCMSCVGFCPYGVMYYEPHQALAFKCISCGQCVKACPSGALKLIEADTVSTELWEGNIGF